MKLRHVLPMIAACLAGFSASVPAQETGELEKPQLLSPSAPHKLDRSGAPRQGDASYYHERFAGQLMADGTPLDPESNVAASRTLPLGTKAIVTNLENGKSAMVEIRDRGPYVEGRIIDVTPAVAERLGMMEQGVVAVEVTPVEVPQQDGTVKKMAIAKADASVKADADKR